MNRNTKAPEIEARLHRSLANQVRVPQLDRRFDAGVWARIEAEERAQNQIAPPAVVRRSKADRWLWTSNVVGIAVAALLVLYFGMRMLGNVNVDVSVPEISAAQGGQFAQIIAWSVTGAALAIAVMFTPLGRWLRSELTRFGL